MRALALALALLAGCATNPADVPITYGQALYLIREERAQREAFDKHVAEAVNRLHPPKPAPKPAPRPAPPASVAPVGSK